MKIFHISDLHLGKRLNEFSLYEDQEYILYKMLEAVGEQKPDVCVIAGDVYDKPIPPAEAVTLFDGFLYRLSNLVKAVFVISGNHDSAERLSFGGRLMSARGVYISRAYDGDVSPTVIEDDFGEVRFYLLPFLRPSEVRRFFPDEKIENYTDALVAAISKMNVDPSKRNVLVTHQFVAGGLRSDSEETSVGGLDSVDPAVFDCFDYVALGHLHKAQKVGRDTLRYCGTPLKYSFSEINDRKSATLAELLDKGEVKITEIPLLPKRDLREIRGSYEEIMTARARSGAETDDYVHIILDDPDYIEDAAKKLSVLYPNLMALDYSRLEALAEGAGPLSEADEKRSPLELFDELFEHQNGLPMNDEQRAFCLELIEEIWGDKNETA